MQRNRNNYDYVLKIISAGNSGVGKTKLIERFHTKVFQENATIGIDMMLHTTKVSEDPVKFQVWNYRGRHKFSEVPVFREASGIIIVYDITDRQSFTDLSFHHREAIKYASENVTIIIVGTKADLEAKRTVTIDEAREFADQLGCMYIETSARTGLNVDNAFVSLATAIIQKLKSKENNGESIDIAKGKASSSEDPKKRRCI